MPIAFDKAAVRPDALDHHDARLKPIERLRMDQHGAAPVPDSDKVPIGQAELRAVLRVDQSAVGRPSLARDAGTSVKLLLRNWRAGGAIRRKGCSGVASSITSKWSGSAGISRAVRPHAGPVGLEVEAAVRRAEAVHEMRVGSGDAIVPAGLAQLVRSGPAGCLAASLDQFPLASCRSRDDRRPAASPDRRSPHGCRGTRPAGRSACGPIWRCIWPPAV